MTGANTPRLPEAPIRVLLIEDHAFTRDGLRVAINFEPDLQVVGEARSGEEGLELLTRIQADVVVLDIGLPGIDGIETAIRIRTLPGTAGQPDLARPDLARAGLPRIVMLTAHNLQAEVLAAMSSGANAYCLKSADPELLLAAIRAAAVGSAYLDPQIAHHVLGAIRTPETTSSPLTPRETEVLRLIADGQGNKEIARTLSISVSTVKFHVQDILEKLSASDRTQAAVKALRQGLL
ncbi:LuxR C-terminal-related transcriptional regulator [Deinococcus altitudinis]|uniref:LuxR C-terminal-related transcriptional regulator n=1 Tax=Deinococcus altitudinis TaxID=468914 RepID=UPI003892106C